MASWSCYIPLLAIGCTKGHVGLVCKDEDGTACYLLEEVGRELVSDCNIIKGKAWLNELDSAYYCVRMIRISMILNDLS